MKATGNQRRVVARDRHRVVVRSRDRHRVVVRSSDSAIASRLYIVQCAVAAHDIR